MESVEIKWGVSDVRLDRVDENIHPPTEQRSTCAEERHLILTVGEIHNHFWWVLILNSGKVAMTFSHCWHPVSAAAVTTDINVSHICCSYTGLGPHSCWFRCFILLPFCAELHQSSWTEQRSVLTHSRSTISSHLEGCSVKGLCSLRQHYYADRTATFGDFDRHMTVRLFAQSGTSATSPALLTVLPQQIVLSWLGVKLHCSLQLQQGIRSDTKFTLAQ